MSENIFSIGSPLNIQESIREDDDSDLLFGSLEDERSPSIEEEIHLRSVSDPKRSLIGVHRQTSLTKEQIVEQFIGTANIRAKFRRCTVGLTGHWKDAAKKAGDLVDPW